MAEPRRVQLTTLSSYEPPASEPTSASACGLEEGETRPDRAAGTGTIRLELQLFESDLQNFPEFNYSQLVEEQVNHTKAEVTLSIPEDEAQREREEIVAITRQLEQKYGGKPVKKTDRIQDLIDIGYGYDDEDSFIDNTEAYDEFVPASITTKLGGFYVNSGKLLFRQATDVETDELTSPEKSPEGAKKCKLTDGSDKLKDERCREAAEKMSNMDPQMSTLSKNGPKPEMKLKKKKLSKTLSVTNMLKKFRREKGREHVFAHMVNQEGNVARTMLYHSPADAAGGGGASGLSDPLLSLIGSTNDQALIQAANTTDFHIDLDSLLDATEEIAQAQSVSPPAAEDQIPPNRYADLNVQTAKTNLLPKPQLEQTNPLSGSSSTPLHPPAPLTEGLSPGLEESIRRLRAAAKISEGESKLKFFNQDINSILLDIELQCRELGGPLRSKVYTHLSYFLPCSRDTLLKRVKKLTIPHAEKSLRVEDSLLKLREAIGKSMPEQIACFHENRQTYEQVKISKATEEDNAEDKSGKRGGPKKTFKWNEEIRECLGHVLKEKVEKNKIEGKNGNDIEEYLKTLLDNEIKPLWPKGWMQSRMLIRESRKLLGLVTSVQIKKAKCERKLSPSRDASNDPPGVEMSASDSNGVEVMASASSKQVALKDLHAFVATPAEVAKPQLKVTPAPPPRLRVPTDETAFVSQQLLVTAVAQFRSSDRQRKFGLDLKSPPPPPQSSPVCFPVTQTGNVQHVEAAQIYVISD